MEVVVIGAGLGGLAAACHLRGEGHDVLVLERGDQPGGRAGLLERKGYRFDTGPTVLTMPDLIADCFHAVGAEMADHVTLHPVDPMYRAHFDDGSILHVRHGRDAMTAEIAAVCGTAQAAQFGRFCDWLSALYAVEMPNFIDANFDSVLDLARRPGPGLKLLRLGGFGRLGRAVARFFDDPRLQRIFTFQSMYAGLAPYQALALYAVITYMDSVEGVFFPAGGIHSVPAAMATAAGRAGVSFRYGASVERILLAHGTSGPVRGVRMSDGEDISADAVVCNADLPVAYRTLLGGLNAPRVARRGRYSPSCVVWHAGVRGDLPEGTAHHNIHFGSEWDGAFRELLQRGVRMTDPSILVTVHSLDDPEAAPPGAHTLYVLEPVPNLDGQLDWAAERTRMRDDLAGRVAALGYPDDIEVEELVDPLDWERQGMERGTPFALAHTFRQTGPFRPANVDGRAPGLVFVGSGTVPGVGVPMVLVSGKLAAKRVSELAAKRREMVTLEESYAECRRLNRRYGTTYYWSTYALPRVKRHHVHALYGFCRYADDIVDDLGEASVERRAAALSAFGERFFSDLAAGSSTDPVLKAVIHTVRAFDIDVECFRRFLRSMEMDLTVATYDTFEDLRCYTDGSAAVIGEMMLPILEPSDPAAAGPARDLGDAFQLTNFLRDIDEDLERGRVYIPQEDIRRFGAQDAFAQRRPTAGFIDLMRFEIERTRELYRSATTGFAMLPPTSARCIRAAHALYGRILDVIEANEYDVFRTRARVPTWQKAALVARVLLPIAPSR